MKIRNITCLGEIRKIGKQCGALIGSYGIVGC